MLFRSTLRDFAPVAWCVQGAALLAAHPSLPAKNVKELVALAKSRPGQLNYGHAGLGSSNHMAGELLKVMTGINILHVPYKGNTPSITDAISGNVEMVFSGVPALVPHIKSGRLRGIAISSLERFAAVPDVPTFDESGVKGYEASNWFGLMAPIKTPRDLKESIEEIRAVVGSWRFFHRWIALLMILFALGHIGVALDNMVQGLCLFDVDERLVILPRLGIAQGNLREIESVIFLSEDWMRDRNAFELYVGEDGLDLLPKCSGELFVRADRVGHQESASLDVGSDRLAFGRGEAEPSASVHEHERVLE